MHGAKVGVKSYVGEHSIINTNSSIDHNCEIGNFSHISTSVTLNGNVEMVTMFLSVVALPLKTQSKFQVISQLKCVQR